MPRRFESVRDRMPKWESVADWGLCGLLWPTVEQPSQDEKEVLQWTGKNLGQYSSLSLSLAHLSHTTNITLSRIKCERYIFIKKCIRSLMKSSLPVNDVSACKCIFVYVHVQLYYEYTTQWVSCNETWLFCRNHRQSIVCVMMQAVRTKWVVLKTQLYDDRFLDSVSFSFGGLDRRWQTISWTKIME